MPLINYPDTLPCPRTGVFVPADRVRRSDLPGLMQFRGQERDFRGVQDVTLTFSATEAQVFNEWWRDTLLSGGLWFNATTWPLPPAWSGQAVRRFAAPPQWSAIGNGYWSVSARVEVRGASLPVGTREGHRYWRIWYNQAANDQAHTSVRELEFREVATGATDIDQTCTGGTPIASSYYVPLGWVPAYAFDGSWGNISSPDGGQRWSSGDADIGQAVWLGYDFGESRSIVEVAIGAGGSGQDITGDCQIEFSDDGLAWTLAATVIAVFQPSGASFSVHALP